MVFFRPRDRKRRGREVGGAEGCPITSRGMKIRVVTDQAVQHQAGEIAGTVYVSAGDRDEGIESLRLELQELVPTRKGGSSVRVRQTSVLQDEPVTVVPGAERAYRFAFQLPQNCRVSNRAYGWRLVAVAAGRPEGEARTALALDVQPAREILALIEACVSRLRWSVKSRTWGGSRGMTRVVLRPSAALRPEIDSLQFTLSQNVAGGVGGSLLIRHARKTFLESVRALFGPYARYRPRKPIAMALDQFFRGDARANEEAIAQHIEGLIDEAIRERGQKS